MTNPKDTIKSGLIECVKCGCQEGTHPVPHRGKFAGCQFFVVPISNPKEEKHICCDGDCRHDDCCGKIPENCPLNATAPHNESEKEEYYCDEPRCLRACDKGHSPTDKNMWVKDFAKVWREGQYRGFDTYEPMKEFISNLLSTEKEKAEREILKGRWEEAIEIGRTEERTKILQMISDMRPILWNDDPEKHKKNIFIHEFIETLKTTITSNQDTV